MHILNSYQELVEDFEVCCSPSITGIVVHVAILGYR